MEQNKASVIAQDVTTQAPAVTIPIRLPSNYGLPDCQCKHCINNRAKPERDRYIINHGPRKETHRLGSNEINRVSLPGDSDYK